jgi:hypothetical protein
MPIRILVVDAYNHPAENVEVYVKWSDGLSTIRTDAAGIADTKIEKGTVLWVSVYGKTTEFGAYYENKTLKAYI